MADPVIRIYGNIQDITAPLRVTSPNEFRDEQLGQSTVYPWLGVFDCCGVKILLEVLRTSCIS